jgi:Tfp pilus assembly protein PilF
MGDRLVFLPSAFVMVLVAWGVEKFARGAGGRVVLGLVLVLLCVRTVTYAWRWNDRLRLFEYAVRERPEVVQLRILLAEELERRGEVERAGRVIDEAIAVEARYWKLWVWRARIAIKEGRLDEARGAIERAWALEAFPPEVLRWQEMVDEAGR